MVRNLTHVRKNKSKGKKMQTRKRTTTKKGGKKQTKQNKKQTKQNKKHNKKQGGRKTYKKRGGDNGDSDNMSEQNINDIDALKEVRGKIYLRIKYIMHPEKDLDENKFYLEVKRLYNMYNEDIKKENDSDREVDPVKSIKEGEELMEKLTVDLENHIFGDQKPKILDRIEVDTLTNLPNFKSLFTKELTPEQKKDEGINQRWWDHIMKLNDAIRHYNKKLVELNLVKPEPEPEPQNKGFFRNPFSRNPFSRNPFSRK
jgi:hypothetical protein